MTSNLERERRRGGMGKRRGIGRGRGGTDYFYTKLNTCNFSYQYLHTHTCILPSFTEYSHCEDLYEEPYYEDIKAALKPGGIHCALGEKWEGGRGQ